LRLGILGGTFDPIHFGHLRMAEEICDRMELEKVYLIPGAIPPHKDRKPITPFHDRLTMTRLAAEGAPFLEVLDLEGRRKGASYTIETLKELRRLFQPSPEFFFIIGTDAFLEIKTWKEYRELFLYTNFVVIKRPGFPLKRLERFILSLDVHFKKQSENNAETFVVPCGNRLIYMETPCMDISSTGIRKMISEGKSIHFLVPEPVRLYIMEKGLYFPNGNP
jgi:nicotinate-nucleotide adenylyltransferase